MEIHEGNIARLAIPDDKGKEAGSLYYLPYDAGLFERSIDLTRFLKETMQRVSSLMSGSTAITAEVSSVLSEADRDARNAVDRAFGIKTADEVFRLHRPFELVGNRFWMAYVVDAANEVADHVSGNLTALGRRMKKISPKKRWFWR